MPAYVIADVKVSDPEQYKQYMPRTWRYLERNLRDPAMAGLKTWFDRHVPVEARA